MSKQSSKLRTLQRILQEAIKSGKPNTAAREAILPIMKLPMRSDSVILFYGILSDAVDEVMSLKNASEIAEDTLKESLQSMAKLNSFFVENNLWNTQWQTFKVFLKGGNYTLLLDSLSNYHYSTHKCQTITNEDINKITNEIENILSEITNSDLPQKVKHIVINYIDEILEILARYHIEGTEALQSVAKAMMTDILLSEKALSVPETQKHSWNRVKAFALGLFFWSCPSPSDMISVVPAIDQYWVPTYEKLIDDIDISQKLVDNSSNFYEAYLERYQEAYIEQYQKLSSSSIVASLDSSELKALPESREEE